MHHCQSRADVLPAPSATQMSRYGAHERRRRRRIVPSHTSSLVLLSLSVARFIPTGLAFVSRPRSVSVRGGGGYGGAVDEESTARPLRVGVLFASPPPPGDPASAAVGGDLVSSLARLDQKWDLARRESGGGKKIGDWVVLDVSEKEGGENDEDDDASPFAKKPEIVYLLEPASGATPSCLILFLGGAVLGQFPHVAYSEFLKRLASEVNGAVIAVPYEVGLDHFELARSAMSRIQKAAAKCEDSRGYSPDLPKYAVGHSLGAKLHAIGVAATGGYGDDLAGIGFAAYNNFGFADTIKMGRSFAKEMQAGTGGFGTGPLPLDAFMDLAEMAVGAVGLEFTPSPEETERMLREKFDGRAVGKTRLFSFDDDDLDSGEGFVECCEQGGGGTPSMSNIPGTHLTPVYLKLGLDDLPEETREVANQVTGGFKNASFGDEDRLNALVSEVSDWMLGKSSGNGGRVGRRMIAGVMDAEVEE